MDGKVTLRSAACALVRRDPQSRQQILGELPVTAVERGVDEHRPPGQRGGHGHRHDLRDEPAERGQHGTRILPGVGHQGASDQCVEGGLQGAEPLGRLVRGAQFFENFYNFFWRLVRQIASLAHRHINAVFVRSCNFLRQSRRARRH